MTEIKTRYCQSCGKQIPLEAQICPNCEQWTIPLPVAAPSESPALTWIQKMGTEGLLALVGFMLMAVSAFLPWVDITSGLGQIHLTGLQVMRGEPGIWLLIYAVSGGLLTWFLYPRRAANKWVHDGLSDIVVGIGVMWVTRSDMNALLSVAVTGTRLVRADLGSGSYLAIVSGLLVMVAGIVIEVKSYNSRARLRYSGTTVESSTIHAKSKSGLRGSFSLDEQTVNEQVNPGYPGVYALGEKRETTFFIQSIGRSDTDINARLKEHIGKYDRFKFEHTDSSEAAFIKECELYHTWGGPEGKIPHIKNHPERSQGAKWSCPKCNVFSQAATVTTTGKRFCGECGMELSTDVRFCTSCGKAAS